MGIGNRFKGWLGAPVPREMKLGREAVTALIIHGSFQFGASMSGLFLNLYLWRLTQDLTVNGIFNMIAFAMTPVAFAAGGWISKRWDRMVVYRIGLLTTALFYLAVVIAQEEVAANYALFAICKGISDGMYWVAYLVLMYDVSTAQNRIRFLAVNMIVFNAAGLAGPALAGTIIRANEGLSGYIVTFLTAFAMFAFAAVISVRIKPLPSRHKTYYLRYMGLVARKNLLWLRGLFCFFVLGLLQGVMLFLPNILLYRTVGREDWVGYLGVFFAGITVATGYVISRKASREHVRRYLLFATTGTVLGAGLLLIEVRFWSVLLFMMLFSMCNPLAVNTLSSYYYRLMDTLPLKGQLRIESVVVRELFVNSGRVAAIAFLLLSSGGGVDSSLLPIVIVVLALLQYALGWLAGEEGAGGNPAANADTKRAAANGG